MIPKFDLNENISAILEKLRKISYIKEQWWENL